MSWVSTQVDKVLSTYHKHCCCTSDPRDDPQARCGDVVVFTDWDTKEDGSVGYVGHIPDPLAVRQPPTKSSASCTEVSSAALPRDMLPASTSRATSPERASARPASDGSEAAVQEAFALRELMKRFVQEMIRGKQYLVVVENGQTSPCKLSLTPNLQYLQLEAAGIKHDIPLRNIKDICPGKLLENRFTPIQLDDLCNTLVLRNNECVTFRLGTIQERDDFTKCIKVLSLALE